MVTFNYSGKIRDYVKTGELIAFRGNQDDPQASSSF
jgi:hypothetical protein